MSKHAGSIVGSRLAVAITTAIITTVVVAGGIALASVPNNSVNSAKIVNNTIRSEDIRNGGIAYVDLGGGIRPRMARVEYNAGVPSITAQRGGISIVNEPFAGAVRLEFGRNMDTCAVTATSSTGGTDATVRRSTTGTGTEVVVVSFDTTDGSNVEEAFDLIAQC